MDGDLAAGEGVGVGLGRVSAERSEPPKAYPLAVRQPRSGGYGGALRAVRVSPRPQLKAKVRPTDNGLRGQEKRGGVSGELVSSETAALFVGICTARRAPPKAAARVLLRRRDSPRVAETTAECRQGAQTHPPRAATAFFGS